MIFIGSIQHRPVTASGSVAIKVFATIIKGLAFGLRLIWALAVLLVVCLLWLVLFLTFGPFLLIASLFSRKKRTTDLQTSPLVIKRDDSDGEFVFDRRRDISKLFGCNTRNVQYRWNIFAAKLDHIKSLHEVPVALDFGAGSLRDSFELARLGFQVTSVDLNHTLLESYFQSYDWGTVSSSPRLFTGSLKDFSKENQSAFHLAIAFDVIEHLETPAEYCEIIRSLLEKDGLLFTIVPNRRSIFERYFKHTLKEQSLRGVKLAPGVPHLQFKTPEEWNSFFEKCGFKILNHEMAIGFFVNDCWNGALGLPLRVYVGPVLARLAMVMGWKFDAGKFEEAFSPKWLMKRVDLLDELVKKRLGSRFGWNLIVAQKNSI